MAAINRIITIDGNIFDIHDKRLPEDMDVMPANNAGAHNSIYRGKSLGTSVTAEQYKAIRDGTFDDMFLGDSWTINGHTYRICDFDYYYRCGEDDIQQHHVVLMPSGSMNIPAGTTLYGTNQTLTLLSGETATLKKWNASASNPTTNTTAGGYKFSRMRTVIMKAANQIVVDAFGADHLLPITERFYNPGAATDSGLADGAAWFNQDDQTNANFRSICDLCNETMVYGQQIWGLGKDNANAGYEIGIDKLQLSIFARHRNFVNTRTNWWLRSVYSSIQVATVYNSGNALYSGSATNCSVRPRFVLIG